MWSRERASGSTEPSLDEVQVLMKKTSDEGTTTPATAGPWAYAYQMQPPQTEARMALIRALVDEENGAAKRGLRKWTAQLVVEPQVTHVLSVSENAEFVHGGNRKLEAELKASGVRFSMTMPMLVAGPGRS